jgi:hypothetical protein
MKDSAFKFCELTQERAEIMNCELHTNFTRTFRVLNLGVTTEEIGFEVI